MTTPYHQHYADRMAKDIPCSVLEADRRVQDLFGGTPGEMYEHIYMTYLAFYRDGLFDHDRTMMMVRLWHAGKRDGAFQ